MTLVLVKFRAIMIVELLHSVTLSGHDVSVGLGPEGMAVWPSNLIK